MTFVLLLLLLLLVALLSSLLVVVVASLLLLLLPSLLWAKPRPVYDNAARSARRRLSSAILGSCLMSLRGQSAVSKRNAIRC